MSLEDCSIRLKIDKASVDSSTDLCPSCMHCAIAIKRDNSEMRQCGYFHKPLNQPIAKCSKYYSSVAPSISGMEEIAWILKTSKSRVVGFMSPSEYRKKMDSDG